MRVLHPEGWPRPRGYSNGIAAEGRLVFVAGQIGWDESQVFRSDDLVEQVRQALKNTLAVLAEAGAGPEQVVRMTWYITDKRDYLDRSKEIGAVYRALMGRHYPAMAMVEVSALMEDRAKVEIETTAVL
ncbi:MAG: RidA family protein [Proteobacteria bacterium]|nr:RidA family protein [Pseudomonadota bacterium]MCH8926709.1 RidA family protein [Pseudomonadota bacterium]